MILEEALTGIQQLDTILVYIIAIAPALSAIGACVGVICSIVRTAKNTDKKTSEKIAEIRQLNEKAIDFAEERQQEYDEKLKALQEAYDEKINKLVDVNSAMLKENVELKKKLNKVIEIQTKVEVKE